MECAELNVPPSVTPPPLPQQREQIATIPTPHHTATITTPLPRLEIRPKRQRNAMLLLIGCIVFVVGGAWLVGSAETMLDQTIGLLSMLFFGLGGIIAVPRLLRRQHSMVLTSEALEQKTADGRSTSASA